MSNSVELYVYDLSRGLAKTMSFGFIGKQLDGIWHTGVVVFKTEYFFGGGIQAAKPGTAVTGLNFVKLTLGFTNRTPADLQAFLLDIRPKYTQDTYRLLSHNCNHFSNELSKFLLNGLEIPKHILELPDEVVSTPLGSILLSFDQDQARSVFPPEPTQPANIPLLNDSEIRQAQFKFFEFAPNKDNLNLSLSILKNDEATELFEKIKWGSKEPHGTQIYLNPSFWRIFDPETLLILQSACVLRHVCLDKSISIQVSSLHPWISNAISTKTHDSERLMLLTAFTNFTSRCHAMNEFTPEISESLVEFATKSLHESHTPSRRAASKLLFNLLLHAMSIEHLLILGLTSILTGLHEEKDSPTAMSLVEAVHVSCLCSPKITISTIKSIVGAEILCPDHLHHTLRENVSILQIFSKYSS